VQNAPAQYAAFVICDKSLLSNQKASQPHPDQAAARIIEVVIADHLAATPLVDKSLITEVAWENRPGTEPAWD
jgi:hypothetical protein